MSGKFWYLDLQTLPKLLCFFVSRETLLPVRSYSFLILITCRVDDNPLFDLSTKKSNKAHIICVPTLEVFD